MTAGGDKKFHAAQKDFLQALHIKKDAPLIGASRVVGYGLARQAAAGLGWLRTCIFCHRMTSTTRPTPIRSVMAAG